MPGSALTLQSFGGSTLDSTATLDANSNAITQAVNNANLYSNPLTDISPTNNQITCNFVAGITASYAFGLTVCVKVANASTSPNVSININSLGNVPVILQGGGLPPIGTLVAGGVYVLIYDGASFQIVGAGINALLTTNNAWLGYQYINNIVTIQPVGGVPLTIYGTVAQASVAINSANTAANSASDIIIRRAGGTQNSLASGACIWFYDSVANASSLLQRSGAQTELWVMPTGSAWRQAMVWLDNGSISTESYGPVAGGMVDLTPDTGSYVPTIVGFATPPTPTVVWYRVGKQVTVYLPAISGTSNNTAFTFSLPAAIQPPSKAQFVAVPAGLSTDNTAQITDCVLYINLSTAQFYHNNSAVGWTASGNKSSGGFTFTYLLI
jgi:hypothetical protein